MLETLRRAHNTPEADNLRLLFRRHLSVALAHGQYTIRRRNLANIDKNKQGFNRRDSLTNILVTLGLPSFDTVMANAAMSYSRLCYNCSNRIVMHLRQLTARIV